MMYSRVGANIQGTLFPWLREQLDPVTAALEQLIIVLDTIGLAAYVPGPPRHGRGRKPEEQLIIVLGRSACLTHPISTSIGGVARGSSSSTTRPRSTTAIPSSLLQNWGPD